MVSTTPAALLDLQPSLQFAILRMTPMSSPIGEVNIMSKGVPLVVPLMSMGASARATIAAMTAYSHVMYIYMTVVPWGP